MATLTDMNASLNQSDHIWFARSKVITPAADGYFSIIRVPRTAFIMGTWVLVTTAFGAGAGASITLGYSGNQVVDSAAYFLTTTGSAGYTATAVPYWFSADKGAITVTTNADSGTQGTFTVFVTFAQIS
jgi:hypothetical protein